MGSAEASSGAGEHAGSGAEIKRAGGWLEPALQRDQGEARALVRPAAEGQAGLQVNNDLVRSRRVVTGRGPQDETAEPLHLHVGVPGSRPVTAGKGRRAHLSRRAEPWGSRHQRRDGGTQFRPRGSRKVAADAGPPLRRERCLAAVGILLEGKRDRDPRRRDALQYRRCQLALRRSDLQPHLDQRASGWGSGRRRSDRVVRR